MIKIRNVLIGILLVTTTLVGAQSKEVTRMVRFKDGAQVMTTISPVSLMTFLAITPGDTVYLNIAIDSLGRSNYRVALYAYYPKSVNPAKSDIIIGYVNGRADLFTQVYVSHDDPEFTYVEYYMKGSAKFIKNFDFEYLRIEHVFQVRKIDTPKYFKNFLGRYYK